MPDYTILYDQPPDLGDGVPQPLSETEMQAVMSGTGYQWRAPGSHSEVHAKLHPFEARGYGRNNPGIFHAMERRNPKIAGAVARRQQALVGLNWVILPPKDATAREMELAELTAEIYEDKVALLGSRIVTRSDIYGFALHELVWEMDDDGVMAPMPVYIEPWTVYRWVLERETGFAVGILHRRLELSDTGYYDDEHFTFIPWEKLLHYAVGFTGRNYEGLSRLRSLYYLDEERRRRLVGQAITWERVGEGVLLIQLEEGAGDSEYADAQKIGREWQTGANAYIVQPPTVADVSFEYGGSVLPDFSSFYRYVDHLVGIVLDDSTVELGQSASGARALGTEFRRSQERTMEGLVQEVTMMMRRHFFRPFYDVNGWTEERCPQIHVSGFEEPSKMRLMLQALEGNSEPPIVKTRQDEDVLRLAFGLGPSQEREEPEEFAPEEPEVPEEPVEENPEEPDQAAA